MATPRPPVAALPLAATFISLKKIGSIPFPVFKPLPTTQVDLFVHVDRGPHQQAVVAAARAFAWRYGALNVTAAPARQGLLRTILGAWSPRDAAEVRPQRKCWCVRALSPS